MVKDRAHAVAYESKHPARMLELVDMNCSKQFASDGVWVRVPLRVQMKKRLIEQLNLINRFFYL